MIIETNGYRGYIFCTVALCGQAKRSSITSMLPSPAYARRIVLEMLRDGILSETMVDRGRVLRLKKPLGLELLSEIPLLETHYMRLTGMHHFPTGSLEKARARGQSCIHMMCIESGACVNGFTLNLHVQDKRKVPPGETLIAGRKEYIEALTGGTFALEDEKELAKARLLHEISVFPEPSDTADSYEEKIRAIPKTGSVFFPSVEVKRNEEKDGESSPTLRVNPSRMRGHLLGGTESYAVYYLGSELSAGKMSERTEHLMQVYLENKYVQCYGREAAAARKTVSPKGECIIVYENENTLARHITEEMTDRRKKGNLANVYSKCYAVRAGDGEMFCGLTEKGRKKDKKEELFTFSQIEKVKNAGYGWCDAIIGEIPAIELVTMDMRKAAVTIGALRSNRKLKLHIVCRKRNEELVRKLYADCAGQVTISTRG